MPRHAPFWTIFQRSRTAMVVTDDRRRYTHANGAAADLLGVAPEDLVDRRIEDLTPPELRDQVEPLWRRFLEQGWLAGAFDLLRPDGGRVPVRFSATANVLPRRHLAVWVTDLGQPAEPAGAGRLSDRERQALTLVARGATGPEVADRLGISPETVRTHVRNAMEKLGAHTRAQAIAIALRQGELVP